MKRCTSPWAKACRLVNCSPSLLFSLLIFGCLNLLGTSLRAQVGLGTETPDPSAILHLKSTTQGFLPPVMSTAARLAIISPAEGLIVYDSTEHSFFYYNKKDIAWLQVSIEPDLNTDSQNTLDGAYDEGGAGAGRSITADAGAVAISTSGANTALSVTNTTQTGIAVEAGSGNALHAKAAAGIGVKIEMTGTGRGLDAANSTGNAGDLVYSKYSAASTGAIYAEGGRAGMFQQTNAANGKPALEARSSGTGHGILGITGAFTTTAEVIPRAGVAGLSFSSEERNGLYGHSAQFRGAWGKVTRNNAWTLGPDDFYAGVYGEGKNPVGTPPLSGSTKLFMGVTGVAETGAGVVGISKGFGHGVVGVTKGSTLVSQAGVWGAVQDASWSAHTSEYPFGDASAAKGLVGVLGQSKESVAIWGESQLKIGVIGTTGAKKGGADITPVGKAGVAGLSTLTDASAGFFRSEAASNRPALVVQSKADAAAVGISTYGTGIGLEIVHKDPVLSPEDNSAKALQVVSFGSGIGAHIDLKDPMNASAALLVSHDGLGRGLSVSIENEMMNMEPAASFLNKGKGGAGLFEVIDTEDIGTAPALVARTNAKQAAAHFEATAAASMEPALDVSSAGGRMAFLKTTHTSSTLSGVEMTSTSKGHVLDVLSTAPHATTPSPKAALHVETISGYAAHFDQKGSSVLRSDPAVLISSDNVATGHTVLKVTTASAPPGTIKAAVFEGDVETSGALKVGGVANLEKIIPGGGETVFTGGFKVLGSVTVIGALMATTKAFRIDHPLDDSKYLQHACIESDEMVNIYSGQVLTDEDGLATVQFPEWMTALNEDFRYQLTIVGKTFAQALIWEEVGQDNAFVIKTNLPRITVSWELTGRRKDRYAKENPIEVEIDK